LTFLLSSQNVFLLQEWQKRAVVYTDVRRRGGPEKTKKLPFFIELSTGAEDKVFLSESSTTSRG
jgi:hypothetical protein